LTTRVLIHTSTPPGQTLELEGLVSAAFWIGMGHSEDEVRSVTISADPASLSNEGPELQEFITLLVQREIDFLVDFLPERGKKALPRASGGNTVNIPNQGYGYLAELAELKKALDEGRLTKSQYEENRKILTAGLKGRVEGKIGGR
jgi:hypothetical protein